MMNLLAALILLLPLTSYTQQSHMWHDLPNAPVSSSRIDDVSFVSPTTGWVAERGGSQQTGRVWKTTDGGESWAMQFEPGGACFRCIAFTDSLRGWVGLLGTEEFCTQTDTNVIYHTSDGGESWFPVTSVSGPLPRGLCGMRIVQDSVIVAVGRVRGPAFFMKSTDGGVSWISKDMNAYAYGLVDVHFFTPDSGIAVGMTDSTNSISSGIVLFTSDGGETWDTSHVSSQVGEWCWKITFPSRMTGYVSLQRNAGSPVNVLKTTDGGQTWSEPQMAGFNYYVQGIGFINDSTGWVGGNSSNYVYETADGGSTWASAGFGSRVNRFQFLPNGEGYAVGRTVYKYTDVQTAVGRVPGSPAFALHQNFPNPFNPETVMHYEVSERGAVRVSVVDILGREVAVLINNEERLPGSYEARWNAASLPGGVYFAVLKTATRTEVRKMVYIR